MVLFFARLKPFREIDFTGEYRRLAMLDFDDARQLIDQQCAFLEFYRGSSSGWVRLSSEKNGYIYAVDSTEIVIVSDEWIEERSPEVQMAVPA